MTSPSGGFPPPRSESDQGSPSTSEIARGEAAEVGRTAARSGGEVAGTVGEQAKRVTAETTRQARDLTQEAREQLVDQAKAGQRKAAEGLHALSDQLREMSEKTDGSGIATEVARQASERTRTVASWLEQRQPGDLLDEVRRIARRKPAVFLAGATFAGVLAGRLTRGAIAAQSEDSGAPPPTSTASDRPASPAPTPHAVNRAYGRTATTDVRGPVD